MAWAGCRSGFTLLEVVIVLAIVALMLSAIYSIALGTLTLADDVRRTQQRESRQHAFIGFCEHLFAHLPATALLNLRTTQEGGQYLTQLELENVLSPFDASPESIVTLQTESMPGGGMRMVLSVRRMEKLQPRLKAVADTAVHAVLFENVAQCEWRVFDPASRQWVTLWQEQSKSLALSNSAQNEPSPAASPRDTPAAQISQSPSHPPLIRLFMTMGVDAPGEWLFWIPPVEEAPR